MEDEQPCKYNSGTIQVLVVGKNRFDRYVAECDFIKTRMKNCDGYRKRNEIEFDETVKAILTEAIQKYKLLADWVGVANIVQDIRDSVRQARDGLVHYGCPKLVLPDEQSGPPHGIDGDGLYITIQN